MKASVKYLSVGILLCVFLVSSRSFYLPVQDDYQLQQLETLYRQHRFGEVEAKQRLSKAAVAMENEYWLSLLAQYGDLEAIRKLVELSEDPNEQSRWLKQAANLGDPSVQFRLALEEQDPVARLKLLTASAQSGLLDAQHALVEWFVLNEQFELALPWLDKTAKHYASDAFRLAEYHWRLGDSAAAITWYQEAANLGHRDAASYAANAERGVSELSALLDKDSDWNIAGLGSSQRLRPEMCEQRILPVARSLANMVQAKAMLSQWQQDERLASLPICLSQPVWLPASSVDCGEGQRAGSARIQCSIQPLEEVISHHQITHVVFFNPSNRAYVDAGLMYLDLHDTYSVFIHELAHFAGFVDEYPIAETLAQFHCYHQSAPNLIFDGEIHYQPAERAEQWQQLIGSATDDDIGLYPARSCNNVQVKSYKLTDKRTFLEFHDTNLIPDVYIRLWQQQLKDKKHWFPVAENLARQYEKRGDYAKASQWRQFAVMQQQGSGHIERETDQPTSP